MTQNFFQMLPPPLPRQARDYSHIPPKKRGLLWLVGISFIALALGGVTPSFLPVVALESSFYVKQIQTLVHKTKEAEKPLPASVPVRFNPLIGPDGSEITPIDTNFGIVIPKIGVNATVIPAVNPLKEADYGEALQNGVAHASTSFFPDEEGVVYLFSHSTNYEWFAKDLNAIFYLLKNLEAGDLIVVSYKGGLYTYRLTEKRVVNPSEISYLQPISGDRKLILQTCWPPGSTLE
ncbi:sortase, partial [Patescibacteria group bacterium]|nr:sortase [Patescibacteria group bacterium]